MDIVESDAQGVILATCSGRLDVTSAAAAEAALLALVARRQPVLMDLAGLGYVSSAGLRVILKAGEGSAGDRAWLRPVRAAAPGAGGAGDQRLPQHGAVACHPGGGPGRAAAGPLGGPRRAGNGMPVPCLLIHRS